MADIVVYDKAKWHADGEYPPDLDRGNAFHHSGLFFGWLVDSDLLDPEFLQDAQDDVAAFKGRQITGPELFRRMDGVLADDMLNDVGNAFARDYFDFEHGQFLADYERELGSGLPSVYHVRDTWENYDKLRVLLDRRFRDWQSCKVT